MDFNPTIVQDLTSQGINAVYGDLGDPEIVEYLQIENSKLVINTASDFSDNELLLNLVKRYTVERLTFNIAATFVTGKS